MNTKHVSSFGKLYLVATPIGNLADISPRAIETLKMVDLIAAEDTRHSQSLLKYYAIQTPCIPLHQYNESSQSRQLLKKIQHGQQIAIISDAGTPIISDPGYPLVRLMHQEHLAVTIIPGPCAAIGALAVSGLPSNHFTFMGFTPRTTGAREKLLQQLRYETATLIFYESVHRVVDFMEALMQVFGEQRGACIVRELTKRHESIYHGHLIELVTLLKKNPTTIKGEFVVLVEGYQTQKKDLSSAYSAQHILTRLLREHTVKEATQLTQMITGLSRKKLYETALMLTQKKL